MKLTILTTILQVTYIWYILFSRIKFKLINIDDFSLWWRHISDLWLIRLTARQIIKLCIAGSLSNESTSVWWISLTESQCHKTYPGYASIAYQYLIIKDNSGNGLVQRTNSITWIRLKDPTPQRRRMDEICQNSCFCLFCETKKRYWDYFYKCVEHRPLSPR